MDSENSSKKSPVDFLYSGLEDVLAEVNLKILEMAIVILSLWELCHEKDQSLTPPPPLPIEEWKSTLGRIRSPPANPLEELSQEADGEDDNTPDQSSHLEDENADTELEDTLDIQQQEENGSRTFDIEDSQVDDITS